MVESERNVGDPDRSESEGDAVLITDASVEGEAIASALRARGYLVIDVPLGLLESRVIGEGPRVLIVDVDQPGSLEAVERVREMTGGAAAELICVGDPARAAELGAVEGSGRAFERPVDIDELVEQVGLLAEPLRRDHSARGTTPPPSYLPRRETSPPISRGAGLSEFPGSAEPLDVASILPGGGDDPAGQRVLPTQLSPELEALLAAAERRIGTHAHPSSIPMPDEEVDLMLSPDVLAVLDEPLEPDDDESGTGSGAGTPMHLATRGALIATSEAASTGVATDGGRTATAAELRAAGMIFEGAAPSTVARESTDVGLDTPGVVRPIRDTAQLDHAQLFGIAAQELGFAETPHLPELGGTSEPVAAAARLSAATAAQAPRSTQIGTDAGVERVETAPLALPRVLAEGDALAALARAIAGRASGSLALNAPSGLRRIVLREGDIVTAGSGAADETLLAFLAARGDLERDVAVRLSGKLPPFGRHAGAALIAHGHLGQDDLWPVLRAHAEWVIGRAILESSGSCELEEEPPGRLKAEPSVFGGATGAEVLVETARRVIQPETAVARMGGAAARLDVGSRFELLSECALRPNEEEIVRSAEGRTVDDVLADADPDLASVMYALAALDVLSVMAPVVAPGTAAAHQPDPLDDEAIRQRVRARMALVEDADYFALLGIGRGATSYEIRRAYVDLRRAFEPSRVLTARTADLLDEVRTIVQVLDEAYDILRDPHRRDRYRRAIEAGPPA